MRKNNATPARWAYQLLVVRVIDYRKILPDYRWIEERPAQNLQKMRRLVHLLDLADEAVILAKSETVENAAADYATEAYEIVRKVTKDMPRDGEYAYMAAIIDGRVARYDGRV